MGLFRKKAAAFTYDRDSEFPVVHASICTGEQTAGFKNVHTGKFTGVMLIRGKADLDRFKAMYGIEGEIRKEY